MIKYNYFLENIERNEEDHGHDGIHEATISCYDHRDCVRVLGTDDTLTERIVKVLKGLNE